MTTLNEKSIQECYAFELRIIVQNKSEDGMRNSLRRQALAENELERRARMGDTKAITELENLAEERMG